MNKQDKEKIKEVIKKGKWNYLFKYGILYLGLIGATILILFQKFILEVEMDTSDINFTYTLWIIMGLIFGFVGWKQINNKVRQK